MPPSRDAWGSLGAQVMNDYMVDFVVRECQAGAPFHHIYGVGFIVL